MTVPNLLFDETALGLLSVAVSTGRRNTLVFLERWSDPHEVSSPSILHRQTEVRDMGSMATRRVDEFDRAGF
jgi:hypothetical protein